MADRPEKEKKDKKRKRTTDGASKPSKRVAIEGDQQVHLHLHEADKWPPIIASAPGLGISPSIALKPHTKARKNPSKTAGRGAIATKELILHSSDHAKLDYTAREEEEAGGADALLKHYIGVFDPETGKLEVIEARKMVVRGSVRSQQATAEDRLSRNMRELRNDLGQTFGTKKAKKAIMSVTENAISPDKSLRAMANNGKGMKLSGVDAAMLANIGDAAKNMATREDLAKAADDSKPRPKANANAEDIKDVYTIANLFGHDVFGQIPAKDWQDSIQKAKKEVKTPSRFVSFRVENAASNVEKLKILRWMLFALTVLGASTAKRSTTLLPRQDEVRKLIYPMPEMVYDNFKRRFSDGAGTMSKYHRDLLITHLCAMACLVDNYETDMWDLKEDLKIETKAMTQYFMEIGARIGALTKVEATRKGLESAVAAQHKMAKLKLPLAFPKVSFGRK